jgi:CheY-like chemotaxis protein
MMQRLLEREGWEVRAAADGREALETLATQSPQLILLDLMMPRVNGFDLIRELQKHERWRTIPVIVVTAKQLVPEEREQLNGLVEQVLEKGSYEKDELMNLVKRYVSSSISPGKEAIAAD